MYTTLDGGDNPETSRKNPGSFRCRGFYGARTDQWLLAEAAP